jgi:NarL family two-component system sensor histidine kinase YdfH
MISIIVAGCLLFYLAFQAYNLFALSQQQLPVAPKLIGSIAESSTMIPFVCASFVLYFQQGRAHQRDQALLRELETAHIQLEDYAARVQDLTLTAERQRLARELHDTLAQGLVGLTMQLETIDSLLLMQRGEQARAIVQQAMSRSRATITSARSAIADLRTEVQEARDILDAIEEEAEHFTQATGISCACHLEAQLPQEQQEHLLRTVSEGLTNIARHSRASQAWIRTGCGKEGVTLEIGDNGIGFEPTEVVAGHYGLLGLRERARLMNAHLAVSSSPVRGTQVRLCLPAESGGAQ